nr:sensor histidine kinase [uncultured Marinifilum sp.]
MNLRKVWVEIKTKENRSTYYFLCKLLILSAIFWIVLLVGIFITLRNFNELEHKTLKDIEDSVLATKLQNVQEEIKSATSVLMMLANCNCLDNYLNSDSDNLKYLNKSFANICNNYDIFDQVRYIDKIGKEIVRVNYNLGQVEIVPQKNLQDKSNRYYFYEAIKLNKNEVFISPLDLNIEHGVIETPLKPMIRFATPVFNSKGEKQGVIVLNYLGQNIVRHFLEDNNPLIKGQLMFLNSEGYWFKGPNSVYDWGFMYDHKKDITFKSIYGNVWDSISEEEGSQFSTEQGMFTFKTVNPILQKLAPKSIATSIKDNYHWKIVSFIPSSVIKEKSYERAKQAIFILLILFLAWLLVVYRFIKHEYFKFLAQQELQQRKVRLIELNATKDKLFSIIGHDLINPLNRIEGFSDLLLEYIKEKNYSKIEEYAGIIQSSSNKASQLLSNLLDWSRSQIGGVTFKPKTYCLNNQLDEIILLMSDAASLKSITIKKVVPYNLTIFADSEMISTVLRNLISNSIKFTHKNGLITVSAEKTHKNIQISVCDNGIGIEKIQMQNLFEITKNNSSLGTEMEKGTGLGLVLCNEFIKKHNGDIWVESKVGKGSCFKISLPNK